MKELTIEQWDVEIELEKVVRSPRPPSARECARIGRMFIKAKGLPNDTSRGLLAMFSVRDVYDEFHQREG